MAKNLQQAAREAFRILLDTAPIGIFYKNTENRFIRVSGGLFAKLGLPIKDCIDRSLFDIFPRQQAQLYWEDDKDIISSKTAKLNILEAMNTPKGKRWMLTNKLPCFDKTGKVIGILGFYCDITEQHEELSRLQQQNSLLSAQQPDTALDGMILIGKNSEIISFNERFFHMFKIPHTNKRTVSLDKIANRMKKLLLHPKKIISPKSAKHNKGPAIEEIHLKDNRVFECYNTELHNKKQYLGRLWRFRDITISHNNQKAINSLRGHLLALRELDRKRTAMDLHDGVCQKLTYAKLMLITAKHRMKHNDKTTGETIAQLEQVLNECLNDIRQICHRLIPPELTTIGLAAALENLCRDASEHCDIRIDRSFCSIPPAINHEKALNIYRIVQEALTNICKHSRATKAHLTVRKNKNQLHLTLKSNGNPDCTPNSQTHIHRGMGMQNIIERAAMLNAKINHRRIKNECIFSVLIPLL